MLRQRGRIGLMVAALVALVAAVAGASERTSTEESRSFLVFPKVIANKYRDTIIQITNTSSMVAYAHCFYVNAALRFPDQEEGPDNQPLWQEIDFDIRLTGRQPTHWVVSDGRLDDPFDPPCENASDGGGKPPCANGDCPEVPAEGGKNSSKNRCDGAGIDPGRVPPVPQDFVGELKCIEVDGMQGIPFPGEDLKGHATLIHRYSGDVSKYNAIGFAGLNPPDPGNPTDAANLCLGTAQDPDYCPFGPEYSGCPDVWVIDHFGEQTPIGFGAQKIGASTDLTVVPCTQNFETQDPESVTLFTESYDEFETAFSAFIQVTCWRDFSLTDIDEFAFAGPTFRQTFIRSTSGTRSGVLIVAETVGEEQELEPGNEEPITEESKDTRRTRAAYNPAMIGERALDLVTIPPEQLVPPPTF